jgi:hypothetical protein
MIDDANRDGVLQERPGLTRAAYQPAWLENGSGSEDVERRSRILVLDNQVPGGESGCCYDRNVCKLHLIMSFNTSIV